MGSTQKVGAMLCSFLTYEVYIDTVSDSEFYQSLFFTSLLPAETMCKCRFKCKICLIFAFDVQSKNHLKWFIRICTGDALGKNFLLACLIGNRRYMILYVRSIHCSVLLWSSIGLASASLNTSSVKS